MAVLYTYLKYKDVHTITSIETTLSLSYTINKVTCDTSTTILSGTLLPGDILTIPFYMDGKYSISLSNTVSVAPILIINVFQRTLLSLIDSVESTLCGCTDCGNCNECENSMSTLMKVLSYNNVTSPFYDMYTSAVASSLLCDFTDEVISAIQGELVYGNMEVKRLAESLIAQYYAAFHAKDLALAINVAEQEYVNTKYKYSKIIKCLNKKGMNPKPVGVTGAITSYSLFKFLQKGYNNTNLNVYQIGDIFSGWRNDGVVRYAEAKWLGGSLDNSDNFFPLVQVEI